MMAAPNVTPPNPVRYVVYHVQHGYLVGIGKQEAYNNHGEKFTLKSPQWGQACHALLFGQLEANEHAFDFRAAIKRVEIVEVEQ